MTHELEARIQDLQDEVLALGRDGMRDVSTMRLLSVVAELVTIVYAMLARFEVEQINRATK